MSKRRYKEYLRDDNAVMPRTTRWRSEQCYDENDMTEQNTNITSASILSATSESASTNKEPINEPNINEPQGVSLDSSDSELYASDSEMYASDTASTSGSESSEDSEYILTESFDSLEDENESHSDTKEQEYGLLGGKNMPIYEGADLTENQSLLLLMSFVLKHHLTDQALNDLLTIMNLHLPNVIPGTKYLFYKKFQHQTYVRHYFCENCTFYFGPSDQCDVNKVCSCNIPKSVESAKISKSFFSYWGLESQIQLLLQDESIAECILNQIEKGNDGDNIADATNGYLFKNLKEVHGYGSTDITLLWNADGVPVFRSSSKDLWPIQCAILELPFELQRKNIIMPALWFSGCKVNMDLLLQPFVDEVEHLATEGFSFNEYKTFVLYYSLIIMQGILPQKYLNHFFLFVWSLHKLLGTCISADDLARVKAALDLFIVQMEELYGVEHCTFNVHQLSHLARSTQMCGPLWAVSTFIFESNNATLKNMIQGTQYVADQVCQTYTIMKFLPVFMKQNARENDLLIEVLQHLIHGKSETRKAVKLSEELTALSKPKIRNISVEETLFLTDTVRGTVNNVVYEYNRFIFSGKLYETEHYQRSVRRKNCFIKAQRQGKTLYCKISGLLTLKLCNCPIQHHEQCACDKCNVLMCMPFNSANNRLYKCALLNITSDFISEVSESSDILTLHMHEVISKCIQVTHGGRSYLTDMPNMVEME